MKRYFKPQADLILLEREDILTTSPGDEHGMNVPAVGDSDWQVGTEGGTVGEIGEIGEIGGA
jgi:hypothetical protein